MSIDQESSLNSGGAHLVDEGMEAPAHTVQAVKVIALDEYLLRRPVNFIKLGVEGAEPLVFRGAEKLLHEDRPTILSELHLAQLLRVSNYTPTQVISDMYARGYICHLLEGDTFGPRVTTLDASAIRSVIFSPSDRRS